MTFVREVLNLVWQDVRHVSGLWREAIVGLPHGLRDIWTETVRTFRRR